MRKLWIRLGETLFHSLAFAVIFLLLLLYPKWWERQLKKCQKSRVMLGEEECDY